MPIFELLLFNIFCFPALFHIIALFLILLLLENLHVISKLVLLAQVVQ